MRGRGNWIKGLMQKSNSEEKSRRLISEWVKYCNNAKERKRVKKNGSEE